MDTNDLINIISTCGFPSAMCVLLLYYMQKNDTKHDEEIKHLTETLNANTQILSELSTLIKTLIK